MISVICPVFNEEKYIRHILDFFQRAQPNEKELIVIDGGSNDQTRNIVLESAKNDPSIRLIDNPQKFVPFALNKAIPECRGEIIIRLDAHTTYAEDYFVKIIDCFNRTNTDIAGGPMRAVGNTRLQQAIAIATSSLFGVGDSSFHDETAEGYVDSVYLGAWKKRIFEVTGLFDIQMLRNQDDEFHYRAKSKGFKIYLDPDIRSWYYPRSSFTSLFRQYFQYGLFKPLVIKKVSSGLRLRHLIPAAFVLYLISLPVAAIFIYWWIPLFLYILINLTFSVFKGTSLIISLLLMLVFFILHLSYGSGFIKGQLKLLTGKIPEI